MVYAQLHPFGPARDERRHGELMALIANVNRDPKRRAQPFTPEDFIRGDRPKVPAVHAARQIRANAAAVRQADSARKRRRQGKED